MSHFKRANATWRLQFEKCSKLVFVYKIRIQQFQKVSSTVSYKFANFMNFPRFFRHIATSILTFENLNQNSHTAIHKTP